LRVVLEFVILQQSEQIVWSSRWKEVLQNVSSTGLIGAPEGFSQIVMVMATGS
jgi:hypothetical protein